MVTPLVHHPQGLKLLDKLPAGASDRCLLSASNFGKTKAEVPYWTGPITSQGVLLDRSSLKNKKIKKMNFGSVQNAKRGDKMVDDSYNKYFAHL